MTRICKKIFKAEPSGLEAMLAYTEEQCAAWLEPRAVLELLLAVEEALMNIINYAYPPNAEEKYLCLAFCAGEQSLMTELTDKGRAFNPLSLADPDPGLLLNERQPGGFGIYFAKKFTDRLDYERIGDQNILRLYKNFDSLTTPYGKQTAPHQEDNEII